MNKVSQLIEKPLSLMDKYKIFIFDMDGVFWRGVHNLTPSIDFIKELQRHNKPIYFLTNNSAQTRSHYVDKLKSLGFITSIENIHTSASLTADLLQEKQIKKIFVVGKAGLRQEIQEKGIETTHLKDGQLIRSNGRIEECVKAEEIIREDLEGCVVGSDLDLHFSQVMYGCQVARHNPKNLFLLTNPDKYANISQNINKELMIPGAGCIGAFFQAFCDRQPDECPGKPNPTFLNTLLTTLRVSPQECLFIGDNLQTDIQLAVNAGTHSLLVLSGVTTLNLLQSTLNPIPTYYTSHLFH